MSKEQDTKNHSTEEENETSLSPYEREEEAYTEMVQNTPPEIMTIRNIVDHMHDCLHYNSQLSDISRLRHQMDALDYAFKRLLLEGDTLSEDSGSFTCDFVPMKYAAAFRAQDQFTRTLKFLKKLENEKLRQKYEDTYGDIRKFLPGYINIKDTNEL